MRGPVNDIGGKNYLTTCIYDIYHYRVNALNQGGYIRPKQGPKFKVPLKDEQDMVQFFTEWL